MAVVAGCSNTQDTAGSTPDNADSGDTGTRDASGFPREAAAVIDAANGIDVGAPSDSGSAGGDGAPDAATEDAAGEDAAATPDAASKDGGASPDGAGGNTAIDQACTAECAAQTKLACMDSTCQSDCVHQADDTENPNINCESKYTALAQCEAKLTASEWICSVTDDVPIPAQGKCTTPLCDWDCCVGSLYADPDVWTECMPGCP